MPKTLKDFEGNCGVSSLKDSNGDYPAFAWPGGYPLMYLTADNGILCPECANSKECKEAQADYPDDNQWRIVHYYIPWEGPAEYCDNCNRAVESAYGDSEQDA